MISCLSIDQACEAILACLKQKTDRLPVLNSPAAHYIISIDGRCASGKTTLASALQKKLPDSQVVHLDDFFLRPEQRTPERYATPGKNVDAERLIAEVLDPYISSQGIVYAPFSCKTMSLQEPVFLGNPKILILEGSYSNNSELCGYADLKVFTTIDSQTQFCRIERRNGKEKLADFESRWIPLEEKYFDTLDDSKFDLILDLSRLESQN